jgi:hypothetical protein
VAFDVVDIARDPQGLERLRALGVRTIPVVVRGGRYTFAQNLRDVAVFVGLSGTGHVPQRADRLVPQWTLILRTSQRLTLQMPPSILDERVIASRERPVRILAHHVFRIGEAFLETAQDGAEYTQLTSNKPPTPDRLWTTEAIAAYGDEVIERLDRWWRAHSDPACAQRVVTYYGPQSLHDLLERSTWHSAQHVRQLAAVLERQGIAPDRPLTAVELAGLPMPERLWE